MQTMIALHVSRGLRTKADKGDELSDVVNLKNILYDFNLLLSGYFQEDPEPKDMLVVSNVKHFTVDFSIRTSIVSTVYSTVAFLHNFSICNPQKNVDVAHSHAFPFNNSNGHSKGATSYKNDKRLLNQYLQTILTSSYDFFF